MAKEQHDKESAREKLEHGYDRMIQRVHEAFQHAGERGISLRQALDRAREAATKVDGLTREEAHKVGEWVRRDLHDAGEYLTSTGHELRDWLYMDLELIEYKLFDLFAQAADQTKLALLQFEEAALHADELHSGEVTGPGTLECRNCGELLHFKKAGHIPPCPRCHETVFARKKARSGAG